MIRTSPRDFILFLSPSFTTSRIPFEKESLQHLYFHLCLIEIGYFKWIADVVLGVPNLRLLFVHCFEKSRVSKVSICIVMKIILFSYIVLDYANFKCSTANGTWIREKWIKCSRETNTQKYLRSKWEQALSFLYRSIYNCVLVEQ